MMTQPENNWFDGNYLSLSTRKRDGSRVDTPVWFAYDGKQCLYCFSESKAGKVKRIVNFEDVKVNPCTVTGKVFGQWQGARAEILTPEQAKIAQSALLKSYGWQMRILNIFSSLVGKINKRAYIKVTLSN